MLPTKALTKLNKTLISINGKDAAKFLNGLLTVKPPDNPDSADPVGSFACLLNSKGRVVADLFVYSTPTVASAEAHYLLEVDASLTDRILRQLEFYKLQSEVKFDISKLKSYYFWDDEGTTPAAFDSELVFDDFRVPSLGTKILAQEELATEPNGAENYRIRRYLFGIAEGPEEWVPSKALPLEFCLDYLNGVDFAKGCYVGQELTIRTHHHGVVRKRVVPVVFTAPGGAIPEEIYAPLQFEVTPGENVVDDAPVPNSEEVVLNPFGSTGKQRPAGSIVAAAGNVGLASLRIDKLGHKFRLGNGTEIHPMMPFWWPADVQTN